MSRSRISVLIKLRSNYLRTLRTGEKAARKITMANKGASACKAAGLQIGKSKLIVTTDGRKSRAQKDNGAKTGKKWNLAGRDTTS